MTINEQILYDKLHKAVNEKRLTRKQVDLIVKLVDESTFKEIKKGVRK